MPLGLWNLEFVNANSQRRYPLTADSSGVDISGTMTIPNDFLVEMDIPVSSGLDIDPSRFFIQSLGIYATGYSVVIGYQPASGSAVPVATALIPSTGFAVNTAFALGGIGDYADTVGKLVVGQLGNISNQPSGTFNFTLATARIEPDCVRPIIRGVSSITIVSGNESSVPLYGDIELVALSNIQLVPVVTNGQDPQILISAIQGAGLAEPCICSTDTPPIKRINGIPPDANGNYTMLGNTCAQFTPMTNGLKLNDTCSSPCCGCQELEAITNALMQFGTDATTLQNFLNNLQSQVTSMSMVVLGSKLGDASCISC